MQYHIFISITHIPRNTFSTNTAEITCAGFKQAAYTTLSRCFPRVFHCQILPEMQHERIRLSQESVNALLFFRKTNEIRTDKLATLHNRLTSSVHPLCVQNY